MFISLFFCPFLVCLTAFLHFVGFSTLHKECFEMMLMSHLEVHLLVSSSTRNFPIPAPGCSGPAAQCLDLAKGQTTPNSHSTRTQKIAWRESLRQGVVADGILREYNKQGSPWYHVTGATWFSARAGEALKHAWGLASIEALSSVSGQELCLHWLYPDPAQ